ncbi:NmrA/HSCARG family protein [Leifsonia sp. NPDC058248]|uniref:NmrA/HSCARG family protein n=1 Tax=Leifsonia sp. NPDC058248 TaxID=3346402 RepID=UPI0036DB3E36
MTTIETPTIAVFGATGKQGGAVIDALLPTGARVRALVRTLGSERAEALAERGAEVVYADVEDPASLAPALTGADAFFFITTPANPHGIEGETEMGIALADAAALAGVGHVVYSSVGGAERHTGIPHFESKRRVEEHLETLDLRATFVRPVLFMDNFGLRGVSVEDGQVVVRQVVPEEVPMQMVAVRDIGLVAAAVLQGADVTGGAIEIAGDERAGNEIAAAFGLHLGLPARYEALPIGVLGGSFDATAMFEWFAKPPSYQADFAATRGLDPDVLDLPGWLAATAWKPGE